jgi:dihydrofolate reductase
LRAEPGEGDIAIGGATLAAEAAALGLIDEYRAMVYPVLVGGVAFRSFPSAGAGWISNSSRPAPSARESSTSATAWRGSPQASGRSGALASVNNVCGNYS